MRTGIGKNKNLFQQWLLLAGICFGIFFLTLVVIYIQALDEVTLRVDGRDYRWKTLSPTVAAALAEKKIVLKQGDVVRPSLRTDISEALRIEVIRSFPVRIKVAGKVTEFNTIEQPVNKVLAQAGIKYDVDDRIHPALEDLVHPGQTIKIVKVSSALLVKEVVINPGTEYRKDKQLTRGEQQVLRQGRPGLAKRLVKVFYEDGRATSRVTLAEKIIKPSINTIISLGIKPIVRVLETSRGSYRYLEMKLMSATAYSPGPESCGKYAVYGRTYLGRKAGFGIVAVDPRIIPLGSKLYIEGYGLAEAADIGAAIKGNRIDLCFETYREAEMFGRRKIKVYILE